ncbi:hypothetical protein mru_1579 [Methanobrevibacter ruminantium M1]|uniref:Calpastatin n=1 Tax=Methanobrevibacter ruminantium (strain ATCC 35063 / DSM 1093 / JCM 13430 / OCM 146 / M1) TaxID=634498 RepID=D3E4N5_METRM|nr:DUF1810 domain-containing protein [Methanobrevibacter ruminantium]ADC47429.1 hypothetical protein mru_1579 [Methanobrevibacter ruminantium M1]
MSLDRFIEAQKEDYDMAFREINNGRKRNHYMWYIFPQIKGLGHSSTSRYYGIDGLEEAKEYMENEYLSNNLIKISQKLLDLETDDPIEIFGSTDSKKLKSSMTLFELVSDNEVFSLVLEKYFDGNRDERTLDLANK